MLGDPNLPIEQFPPYVQAKAALAQAQRNLDHTVLRAPMGGIATQVDQIQLGRFVVAGTPVFSVIDTSKPWVDANLRNRISPTLPRARPVSIDVDAFPDHVFKGTIGSLSPGTGAQFAILPPQNATGNFVKVVQRVPVRIYFDSHDSDVQRPVSRHECPTPRSTPAIAARSLPCSASRRQRPRPGRTNCSDEFSTDRRWFGYLFPSGEVGSLLRSG